MTHPATLRSLSATASVQSHHRRAELYRQGHIAGHLYDATHKRYLRVNLASGHLLGVLGLHRQHRLRHGWALALTKLERETLFAAVRQVTEGELKQALQALQ